MDRKIRKESAFLFLFFLRRAIPLDWTGVDWTRLDWTGDGEEATRSFVVAVFTEWTVICAD